MTDFVDLLEAQLLTAHAHRRRGWAWLRVPSTRAAGALVAATAAAAVRARVLEDRGYEEIAAAERVTEPTARQRVSRGLAALRAHLRSQEP